MSDESQAQTSELSTEVFEKFLAGLEQAGISQEICSRLRETLLVDPKFTDTALRSAILGEESQQ